MASYLSVSAWSVKFRANLCLSDYSINGLVLICKSPKTLFPCRAKIVPLHFHFHAYHKPFPATRRTGNISPMSLCRQETTNQRPESAIRARSNEGRQREIRTCDNGCFVFGYQLCR